MPIGLLVPQFPVLPRPLHSVGRSWRKFWDAWDWKHCWRCHDVVLKPLILGCTRMFGNLQYIQYSFWLTKNMRFSSHLLLSIFFCMVGILQLFFPWGEGFGWDLTGNTLGFEPAIYIYIHIIYIYIIYIYTLYIYTLYIYTHYIYIHDIYIYTLYIYIHYTYIYIYIIYIYIYIIYIYIHTLYIYTLYIYISIDYLNLWTCCWMVVFGGSTGNLAGSLFLHTFLTLVGEFKFTVDGATIATHLMDAFLMATSWKSWSSMFVPLGFTLW